MREQLDTANGSSRKVALEHRDGLARVAVCVLALAWVDDDAVGDFVDDLRDHAPGEGGVGDPRLRTGREVVADQAAGALEEAALQRAQLARARRALSPDTGGAALGDALVVGLTYLGAAIIPLWPYAVLPLMAPALIVSVACTLAALFVLGVAKGTVARQPRRRAGLQVLVIGGLSAVVGFGIGHAVTAVVG